MPRALPTVRILGIDPGSRVTGYGIIESDGVRSTYVSSGCIRAADLEFPARLKTIFDGVAEVVGEFAPDEIAIEQVFVSKSVQSALKLGQARGAALAAALARSLSVSEYAPNAIKRAVTGRGHADKVQVQHMVRVLMRLSQPLAADAADALAVALCHAHSNPVMSRNEAIRQMGRRG